MAKLSISGFDDLQADMEALLKMPDSISDDILNAQADIIVDAQKESMAKMLKGPYSTGETARSIKKGKVKKDSAKNLLRSPLKAATERVSKMLPLRLSMSMVNAASQEGQPFGQLMNSQVKKLLWQVKRPLTSTCESTSSNVPVTVKRRRQHER